MCNIRIFHIYLFFTFLQESILTALSLGCGILIIPDIVEGCKKTFVDAIDDLFSKALENTSTNAICSHFCSATVKRKAITI